VKILKSEKKIIFAHKPIDLFPKKTFCLLNKSMGLFQNIYGTFNKQSNIQSAEFNQNADGEKRRRFKREILKEKVK
jgi:hypothetical protein